MKEEATHRIKTWVKHLIVSLALLPFNLLHAEGLQEFPIIACIMHTELYDAPRFRDIHKAGFNACLCWCRTPQKMQDALNHAQYHGMKVIMYSDMIVDNPELTVPLIKDHEALWQYLLADEPTMKRWVKLKNLQERIKKVDPDAQCYINLLPNSSREVLRSIGLSRYPDYLREYSKIEQPQISYDYYPVLKNGMQGAKWYSILEDIRNESRRTGKPFWAFVLCVPHHIYPMPTIGHLRLQCYINLAYGAQGIQYFAYATPQPTKQFDFHDGPLLRNGKKSNTYDLVKRMNTELKSVATLFWGSEIIDIEHRKCVDGEVVVSHFKKGGKKYTCYVNKSAEENVTVNIRTWHYAHRVLKDLQTENVRSKYVLSAGDILILSNK